MEKEYLEEAKSLVEKFRPMVKQWDCYWDAPRDEEDIMNDAGRCAIEAVDLHLGELSKMELIFSDREVHYKKWESIREIILSKWW